jgi:hypothetical protein
VGGEEVEVGVDGGLAVDGGDEGEVGVLAAVAAGASAAGEDARLDASELGEGGGVAEDADALEEGWAGLAAHEHEAVDGGELAKGSEGAAGGEGEALLDVVIELDGDAHVSVAELGLLDGVDLVWVEEAVVARGTGGGRGGFAGGAIADGRALAGGGLGASGGGGACGVRGVVGALGRAAEELDLGAGGLVEGGCGGVLRVELDGLGEDDLGEVGAVVVEAEAGELDAGVDVVLGEVPVALVELELGLLGVLDLGDPLAGDLHAHVLAGDDGDDGLLLGDVALVLGAIAKGDDAGVGPSQRGDGRREGRHHRTPHELSEPEPHETHPRRAPPPSARSNRNTSRNPQA